MTALNLQNKKDESIQIENRFLILYQPNSRFIDRTQFLRMLKEKLFDVTSKHDNHHIALYDMKEIGKTQCVLRYIYENRNVYDRIY